MGDRFVVIRNSEDGDVSVSIQTRDGIKSRLADGEQAITGDELMAECGVSGARFTSSWEFANYGKRGMLIFPLASLVEPKPVQTVTEWEV